MSWLLHLDVEPSELELVSSHLWSLGTSGIAELSDTHVVAGFETESLATRAQAVLGSGTISRYDPTAVPDPQPATVLLDPGRSSFPILESLATARIPVLNWHCGQSRATALRA